MSDTISPHVLIIESDAFLANIYRTAFESQNYKVSIAENGENGCKDAIRKQPNAILLDIMLPKLDGFNVLEQLRNETKTKDLPIIILSSRGAREDIEKAFAFGAHDYIIKKQFSPDEIVERINALLAYNKK